MILPGSPHPGHLGRCYDNIFKAISVEVAAERGDYIIRIGANYIA